MRRSGGDSCHLRHCILYCVKLVLIDEGACSTILRYNLECAYSEASGRGAKRKAAEDAAVSDAPIPKPATVTSEVAQQILERYAVLSLSISNLASY
jgi:hypothetical protein